MDSNNKKILDFFLKNIEDISDKNYQRRVWIEGKGPEWDDFDETANFLLGDGLPVLKNYKDYGITDNQYFLMVNFWEEFDGFTRSIGREYLPDDFIDTPEWTKITEMAKEVLMAFHWKMPVQDSEN